MLEGIETRQQKNTGDISPAGARSGLLAGGGLIGALLTSACCVLPLVLFTLGAGGAWIGALTSLAPYQPVFAAMALGFIGAGFWSLRRRRKACAMEGYCTTTAATRITTVALWAAALLVLLSLAWPYLAPRLLGS